MSRGIRPPRLPRALAALCLPAEMREIVVGDLDEEFAAQIAHGQSRRAAARRYWRQTLASIVAGQRAGAPTMSAIQSLQTSSRPGAADGFWLDLRHALRVLGARAASPRSRCCRSRSASAPTRRSSASFACCCSTTWPCARRRSSRSCNGGSRASHRALNDIWEGRDDGRHAEQLQLSDLPGSSLPRQPPELQTAGIQLSAGPVVQYADQPALRPAVSSSTATSFRGLAAHGARPSARPTPTTSKAVRPTVVLSYAFWMRAFGGDPSVIGQAVR